MVDDEVLVKLGYADPPYPGQSYKHYRDHPDYDGEVDHSKLLHRLDSEYDGWVLHTSSTALPDILRWTDGLVTGYRIMAWVKPFAAFKRNVSVAYTWEPVLIKCARKPVVRHRVVMRDFIEAEADDYIGEEILDDCVRESIVMRKGLTGVKPEKVCHWAFEMMGAEPTDQLDDLFPGSGAVTAAWGTWRDLVSTP